jgi:hypothetical protein
LTAVLKGVVAGLLVFVLLNLPLAGTLQQGSLGVWLLLIPSAAAGVAIARRAQRRETVRRAQTREATRRGPE